MREVGLVSVGAPLAVSVLPAGMPWQGYLGLVLACSLVYICRLVVVWRLGSTALDQAGPAQVPATTTAVMAALKAQPRQPGALRSRARRVRGSSPEQP